MAKRPKSTKPETKLGLLREWRDLRDALRNQYPSDTQALAELDAAYSARLDELVRERERGR